MNPTLSLADCLDRGPEVGGKATGLAALIARGFPVPPGFCVTTDAYREAVREGGLEDRIAELVKSADYHDDNTLMSARIGELFASLTLPERVETAIRAAYEQLGDDVHVAVRSSATAEDLADASFAGQQDTYLYVRGADEVVAHVVRCWASLFSATAIGYRSRFEVDLTDLAMAVVVQQMVPAEAAGVMMTLHPVNGDRSRIYVEASYGLGEGVVRGDVGVDRFEVEKGALRIVDREIGEKPQAHRFVETDGEVRLVDVPAGAAGSPCLADDEVHALARLGERIEDAFGAPMDVEWAIAETAPGTRELFMLQARPETVWSQREQAAANAPAAQAPGAVDPFDDWDPLHTWSDGVPNWTTTNIGEAMPGVMTPLGWTLWSCGEGVFRRVIYNMGVLTDEEREVPRRPHEWNMRPFYGRIAWQVDFFAIVGDRMPGTSAEDAARSLLGRVPDGIVSSPTKRFYPRIARRMPRTALTAPRETRQVAHDTGAWYRRTIQALPGMDLRQAQRVVVEAQERFDRVLTAQGHVTFGCIQPLYEIVEALVRRTGVGDAGVLSGSGGAEVRMLEDLWSASRGELELDELLLRHGYHGPQEGEVSSRPWREDPAPLQRILAEYATRDDADSPFARDAAAQQKYERTVAELLAALPRWQRPAVRRILALAARVIPLRGVAKQGMLQSIDACRAAARRIGALLAQDGTLDDAEDVFFLTVDELAGALPADVKDLVRRRRERRSHYENLVIPSDWRGMPEAVHVDEADAAAASSGEGVTTVSGIGVSQGVVTGRARVVLRADFGEVAQGDVLVAPTTDPSWASIMFISSALVVDIGGALSHAAVVARELSLPCVVNTRNGTSAIRTGDLVRVDGGAGTVEILERATDDVAGTVGTPAASA